MEDFLRQIQQQAESEGCRELVKVFTDCYTNTLNTTVKEMEDGTVHVITGDIPAMWLRDSAAQRPESALWELCGNSPDRMNAKIPFDAAAAGDRCGKSLIENYIKHLADGITDIVNIFRPDVVVLGGGVCAQGENLTAPLNKYLKENCFGASVSYVPQVVTAQNGNDAGMIGAAGLVVQQVS